MPYTPPPAVYLQASAAMRLHGAGVLRADVARYLPRLAAFVIGHGC